MKVASFAALLTALPGIDGIAGVASRAYRSSPPTSVPAEGAVPARSGFPRPQPAGTGHRHPGVHDVLAPSSGDRGAHHAVHRARGNIGHAHVNPLAVGVV